MRYDSGGEGHGWDADDEERGKGWGKLVWSKTSELGVGLRSGGESGGRLHGGRELKEREAVGGWGRCRRLRGMFEVGVELLRGSMALGRSAEEMGESVGCECCRLPEDVVLVFVRDREGWKGLLLTSIIIYFMRMYLLCLFIVIDEL